MVLIDELITFQKTHPFKHANINGKEWEYVVTGKGKEIILIIHGGTGSAESIFRYIVALEGDYSIIAPTIPTEITTVAEALSGLEAILRAESVSKFHAIGFSMGGMIEQVFLRQHPERFKSLVLFHCPPTSKSYAKFMQKVLRRSQIVPWWLMKIGFKYKLERESSKYPNVPKEEKDFWIRYYLGEISKGRRISKERTVNHVRIVLDYLRNYHFTANDLSLWVGKVLIFETATDTIIPEVERKQLKEIYPHAQVHTFPEGDHLGNGIFGFAINTTISVIKDFLDRIS